MKRFRYIFLLLLVTIFYECKKSPLHESQELASLNVINGITSYSGQFLIKTSHEVKETTRISPVEFYSSDGWYNNGRKTYGIPSDTEVNIKAFWQSDTTHVIYNKGITSTKRSSKSLFLFGSKEDVQSLLLEDNLPLRTDSTAGVRIINLCPDATPITVNVIDGAPLQTIVNGLSYKQYTDFLSLPTKSVNQYYLLEVQYAADKEPYYFFYDHLPRMKYETLVIRGLANGGDGPVLEVARFRH